MKTWRFTFKCEYFGAEFESPFSIDADTYHDATILADAYVKEKFPIACEQELATIKLEGLGIDPKDWGKSKRALQEPCVYCDRKMPWKDEKGLDLRFSDPTVFVYGNRLKIEYDSPYCNDCFEREYEISFCPMCGRKLEVEG